MFAVAGIVWGKLLLPDKKAKILKTLKAKLIAVGTIWAVVIISLILFIPVLHWI
jgi:hypothetical protein